MLDLIAKNKEMLDAKAYNIADTRLMMRIASLKTINDYDLYLIACCLCNYDIEEKSDARELRMEYFLKTNNGSIVGFEHGESDYGIVGKSDIKCTNTGNVNKFGLYEYEINVNNKDLVSDLWEKKPKDCLKYVDNKTYEDKLIVSISKSQLDNFMSMLDELVIDYEISDLQKGLIYTNKSGNELIDISTLDLPFEPYQYQIEDAKKLVSKKRALLGHDMGCVSGNSKVRIKEKGKKATREITVSNLFNLFEKDNTIQIKCLVNGRFAYMPIKAVIDKGVRDTIKLVTKDTNLECTADHEIYTEKGWVEAKDLNVGDFVFTNGKEDACLCCGSTDNLITYKYAKWFGYCKNCMNKLKPNGYDGIVKKLDKNGYVRLVGKGTKDMPNYEKMRKQGGIYEHHQVWYENTGYIVVDGEVVHHKDLDKTNNAFENLELMTDREHKLLHADINKQNLPQYNKNIDYIIKNGKKVYFVPQKNEIIAIEPCNKQQVYDIAIDDAEIHNFVCNNIVVHNCGKTLISILIGQSLDMPKLVICPESLRLNWLREIKQVKNDADVQILLSNETPHFGEDWTIVGYQTASKFIDNLMEFECIFVDECHNCKAVNNWGKPSSKRADAVITLANNAEYCYLLSGTPMPSHNKDLFNILKMLKCEAFDFNNKWAFKNYADKYCDPKETYFGMDYSGNSNSDMLHGLLNKLMVRRLKKDVLPHLTKQRQFIPIAPKFKKEYIDIEKRLYFPEPDDTYMGLAMTGRKLSSQYKVQTAIELAESLINSDESVVIVTNFIETADILKNHFKDKACEIRGGMSDKDKQNAIDDFQSKKKTVCILNMMAGGVGITLTASHTMIMVDYAWLPSDMTQVEDRICRSGQTENCMIYYIYCENSILDNIFIEMISDKSANIDAVVDNVENTFNLSEEKLANSTYIDLLKSKIKETKPKAKRGRKKKTE